MRDPKFVFPGDRILAETVRSFRAASDSDGVLTKTMVAYFISHNLPFELAAGYAIGIGFLWEGVSLLVGQFFAKLLADYLYMKVMKHDIVRPEVTNGRRR